MITAVLFELRARKRAEEALRRAHNESEQRVIERTSQLSAVNEELRKEIAERKRVDARLADQANLLANVHDAILATDDQLNVTAWNRAAEDIYG